MQEGVSPEEPHIIKKHMYIQNDCDLLQNVHLSLKTNINFSSSNPTENKTVVSQYSNHKELNAALNLYPHQK